MIPHRLSPGCMIAWAIQNLGLDRPLSIEVMRAMMEAAPTYPETWTLRDGIDYVASYLGMAQ